MTRDAPVDAAWFVAADRDDPDAARDAIESGSADDPADWPTLAIESGFAADEDDYYDALHEATVHATRLAVQERERSDDQQLKHSIRAMDDCERVANELAERVAEWGGSLDPDTETDTDDAIAYARALADAESDASDTPTERSRSLARRAADLADEAEELRAHVERVAPELAPNLSMLAGPVLGARLIALAGGLESLAKQPSGTVQVLGAEDALFAHLRGQAPSPKHGVIYVNEYVRGTDPEHRGSAARALAGKLSIAARIDHYSGDRRPALQDELDERITTIRSRMAEDDQFARDGGET
jgi:nucleolar protein 56